MGPRAGDAGLDEFAAKVERYHLKGVKLYTAEWRGESRGWSLKSDEASRYLEPVQRLGVATSTSTRDRRSGRSTRTPSTWPTSTSRRPKFPGLNFIVEHVGLPRIEDFCFMAAQEPNVYAGLSVVVGGLMHARPRCSPR